MLFILLRFAVGLQMRFRRIFATLFVVVAACYASSCLFPSHPLPGSTSPHVSINSWKRAAFDPVLIAAAIYSASRSLVVTSGFTFVAFTSHVVTTNVRAGKFTTNVCSHH